MTKILQLTEYESKYEKKREKKSILYSKRKYEKLNKKSK